MTTATIIAQGKTFTNYIGKERFLGQYPGAIVAYSMRHIGTSYVGPLIRVRRSLDSKEQDFYAVDGWVSVSELKAFALNGDVFISIWYDQSGNGSHAIQPNKAAQPRIIAAGIVDSFGSRLCARFDGTDDFMPLPESVCSIFNTGTADYSLYATALYGGMSASNIFTLSSKTSTTSIENNYILHQVNAESRSNVWLSRSNDEIVKAVSNTDPVYNKVVSSAFVRSAMKMTLIDQGGVKSTQINNQGVQNYKLATLGTFRWGTNEDITPVFIKIGEFILYDKSNLSLSEEITANIQNSFA